MESVECSGKRLRDACRVKARIMALSPGVHGPAIPAHAPRFPFLQA
jgi:hypothetical protein